MKEEWLLRGAVVPVDVETTSALVAEIKRLIDVVGGMALAQPEPFKPDWDTQAVLVKETQRMAKRIEELEAMLEHRTARIVDLQTHIENFEGEE
jgi:hypothetical protein